MMYDEGEPASATYNYGSMDLGSRDLGNTPVHSIWHHEMHTAGMWRSAALAYGPL